MATRVRLSPQAVKDLAKLGRDRPRVERLLLSLGRRPRPKNLDVKPLRGRQPWSRARVGRFRVVIRPLAPEELRQFAGSAQRGFLVGRIVHRRDLERIIDRL